MKANPPIVLAALLAGCASPLPFAVPAVDSDGFSAPAPISIAAHGDATVDSTRVEVGPVAFESATSPRWSLRTNTDHSVSVSLAAPLVPLRAAENKVGTSYTKLKLGVFEPSGDISSLDSGLSAELVFGRQFLKILSIEGSVGYLEADGSGGGPDLTAIPLFIQARVGLPIIVVEPYGGIGIGGMFADISGTGPGSGDEFVTAANAFLGIEVGIGQLAIGLEGKYVITEKVNSAVEIEGTSISLTATLPF